MLHNRHKLKHGSVRLFIPTVRASLEEVNVGNVKFRAWDVGGHKQVRGAWKDYFAEADAIIFVVDAADHDRLAEAQEVSNFDLLHNTSNTNIVSFCRN